MTSATARLHRGKLNLSRQGHPTIAHRFIGGLRCKKTTRAPGGAKDIERDSVIDPPLSSRFIDPSSSPRLVRNLFRPYRDLACHRACCPTVETVGYCRASLTGRSRHLAASAAGTHSSLHVPREVSRAQTQPCSPQRPARSSNPPRDAYDTIDALETLRIPGCARHLFTRSVKATMNKAVHCSGMQGDAAVV